MNGQIRITIPPELGVTTLTQCVAYQRINAAVAVSAVSVANPYYVVLTGGYPSLSDSVPIAGLVAFRLKNLRNPSTTVVTASFQIETYDSSYIIEKITTNLTIQATAGVITMNALTYSEYKVLDYNTISLDFTLQSALQPGCTLQVVLPTEFTVTNVGSTSCTLLGVSGLTTGYTCSITSNVLTIAAPFGATTSTGGERIKLTLGNNYVQNPSSTRTTTKGIIVRSVSALGNPIDVYTGSVFTAKVNEFTSVKITPSTYVTGDYPVTYTFEIQTLHSVENNAYIVVKWPVDDSAMGVYDTSKAGKGSVAVSSNLNTLSGKVTDT